MNDLTEWLLKRQRIRDEKAGEVKIKAAAWTEKINNIFDTIIPWLKPSIDAEFLEIEKTTVNYVGYDYKYELPALETKVKAYTPSVLIQLVPSEFGVEERIGILRSHRRDFVIYYKYEGEQEFRYISRDESAWRKSGECFCEEHFTAAIKSMLE